MAIEDIKGAFKKYFFKKAKKKKKILEKMNNEFCLSIFLY